MRWGIMGTGVIAGMFVTDLQLTTKNEVVAVGSRTQASADEFGARYGIRTRHGSYESLVADTDVEAIYVATPNPIHRANAILAIDAGKPVLVEKPFAMNAGEAREIISAARGRRVFAMEAMWTRFLPHMRRVREWIADAELGEIVTVTADHGWWFEQDATHRLFAPELGGGSLLDLGVYVVSFASMVLGAPSSVLAMVTPALTGVDAQTSMIFGYESGAQALLNCSLQAKTPARAAIVGTAARVEVSSDFYAPTEVTLIPRDGKRVVVASEHLGRGLRHQADEVARRVEEGDLESPLMSLDETVEIMETLDLVRRLATGPITNERDPGA